MPVCSNVHHRELLKERDSLRSRLEAAERERKREELVAWAYRGELDRAKARLSRLEEALKQIQARAQAIPANPIGNEIEDIARSALSPSREAL